jgi:uncharacterized 2Fe-2S/4Fe-4S cluster protein (DUF4445 family)
MRVRFEPSGVSRHVEAGLTLLQVAIAAGVEIEAVCGGRGTCGKCRVIATEGLAEPTEVELRKLSQQDLAAGYRLACQAVITGDVEVVVPDESRISRVSILTSGVQGDYPLEPWVRRHVCDVTPASLDNQIPDLDNLRNQCPMMAPHVTCALNAVRRLPSALRHGEWRVTLLQADDEIIRVDPGDGPERLLGIAFDIGTTTIAGYLVDLETGEQLGVGSLLNPQTRYGDDVVSRIEHASEGDGLQELQATVIGALNQIIAQTTGAIGADPQDILGMTVVGNTTMHHLFLGISPAALAQSPYVPVTTDPMMVKASDLGLSIWPDTHVWVLPNIAGWVGADTVGVILATNIHQQEGIGLAIDIGTNGEMALGSRDRLITCSTAAGPAFEGAQLSCGMRAADGAIEKVSIDHEVHYSAIGNSAPRGICGSGLVDAIAEMLKVGIIAPTGKMQTNGYLRENGYQALAERIEVTGRLGAFRLVDADQGAGGRPVLITQRDVRELQLAKGAIRAGIEILMKELGAGPEAVTTVYLAGAFGNYIQPQSALAIGLMPTFPNAKLVPVGNAAGSGARMALLSRSAREETRRILAHTEYIELSGRPDFQAEFSEAMLF